MNEAKYCNFYLNMNNMLTLTPGGRESKCYMTIDQKPITLAVSRIPSFIQL